MAREIKKLYVLVHPHFCPTMRNSFYSPALGRVVRSFESGLPHQGEASDERGKKAAVYSNIIEVEHRLYRNVIDRIRKEPGSHLLIVDFKNSDARMTRDVPSVRGVIASPTKENALREQRDFDRKVGDLMRESGIAREAARKIVLRNLSLRGAVFERAKKLGSRLFITGELPWKVGAWLKDDFQIRGVTLSPQEPVEVFGELFDSCVRSVHESLLAAGFNSKRVKSKSRINFSAS